MNIRQQIHIAFVLLLFAGLACTIRMPSNMAQYSTPVPPPPPAPPIIQSTSDAIIANSVITDAQVITAPQVIEPVPLPTNAAAELPESAAVDQQPHGTLLKDLAFVATFSVEDVNRLQAEFYPASNQIPAQYAVDKIRFHFKSRNEMGHWNTIRAEMFIPKLTAPAELPLFVYGAGTTGIGNLCAPLDEELRGRNWGQYQHHLISYAAQGFITVMPHWQGYDDQTRRHNYFIASLEATTLLDATRAAYEIFNSNVASNIPARPAQAVFYGGYSQGGHGAFAALDVASRYAPEISIRGIVGHATAPSVEALLRERPQLAPYIIYSFQNYYGGDVIDPNDVFLSKWLPTFYDDASTKCVDEAYQYYPENGKMVYDPGFFDALYGGRLAETFPALAEALEINYVGASPNVEVPVVLFHGAADNIVTPQTHDNFVGRLCNGVKNVNYKLYTDIGHFQTRQYSFVDSVTWMRNVYNGQPPESQCAEFFTSQFDDSNN